MHGCFSSALFVLLLWLAEMLQVPKPQVQVQVLRSQVQVQVLKTNYQVQHKYRYQYVINKESNSISA